MMSSNRFPWLLAGLITITLGAGCVFLAVEAFRYDPNALEGRLLSPQQRGQIPWKTILPEDLEKGVSIPADTNILIHFPSPMERITRRVLFGDTGRDIRYWGYCFPLNPQLAAKERSSQAFPGTLFLSEKEREIRAKNEEQLRRERFSVSQHLQSRYLDGARVQEGRIRHQQEIFEAGMTCYVMTEFPLPVGLDPDNDLLNNALERDFRTDPNNPDTDGDGLLDGLEALRLKTSPTLRDTDGDGLPDGLEDRNRNGRVDYGETSPLKWDTDGDGLCDGWCMVQQGGSQTAIQAPLGYTAPTHAARQLRGEDKNLNGIVDDGETDPLKADTNGDGILDEQHFFINQLKEKTSQTTTTTTGAQQSTTTGTGSTSS